MHGMFEWISFIVVNMAPKINESNCISYLKKKNENTKSSKPTVKVFRLKASDLLLLRKTNLIYFFDILFGWFFILTFETFPLQLDNNTNRLQWIAH